MSHCIEHRSQVFAEGLWGVKKPKFGWRHLGMISYQIFLERLELILKTFISLCQRQTIIHRILDVILKQNLIQLRPEKIIHRILDDILKQNLIVTTQKHNIQNPDYSRIQILDTIFEFLIRFLMEKVTCPSGTILNPTLFYHLNIRLVTC